MVGNDMSVLIGLDLSCKSTFPDFDQFSPSASDSIVSTKNQKQQPVLWRGLHIFPFTKTSQNPKRESLNKSPLRHEQ